MIKLHTNNKKYITIFCVSIIIIVVLITGLIYLNKSNEPFDNNESNGKNGMNAKNGMKSNYEKVAFLFLTRDNLRRPEIWNTFFNNVDINKYSIYCHPKNPEKVSDTLLKNNIIPENINTEWGKISLVEANILLMKNALKDTKNKKMILVSESCIPIVSFDTFYNTIINDNKSRIARFLHNNTDNRYNDIVSPAFKKEHFYKTSGSGSILNRNHAQLLVDNMKDLPKWEKVIAPDEHYNLCQLLVYDKNFLQNNINKKTTFDIWQIDDLNKQKYEKDDIQTKEYILLSKLTNKGLDAIRDADFLLIRKVDENTIL